MPASLSARVIARLAQAEHCERNPLYLDDLRIARLTVAYARGEAVLCSPDVLASYTVLGLHPEKVWPAILARRTALGGLVSDAPPKKPAQAVKLWCEKTNGERAVNSLAVIRSSGEPAISVPMATPSITALYPKPDEQHSGKTRDYSLSEIRRIVAYSGAPNSICALTSSALRARGEWPNQDGPATTVLSVAILGMMLEGVCCRSTVQRRIKRAVKLGFWRRLRDANSWIDCPKCSAKRRTGTCGACGYRGKSRDAKGNWTGEFMRVPVYEFDIHKFRSAPRCREIRHFDARTYAEYKAAAKRGEHPNVTEMPSRKPAQPTPPEPPPVAAPVKQPAAEHAHRNTARPEPTPQPKLTKRECAKFVADMAQLMRGHTHHTESVGGYGYELEPDDPRYRPKMSFSDALTAVAQNWKRQTDVVIDALKFYGYKLQE
jgi:transposase